MTNRILRYTLDVATQTTTPALPRYARVVSVAPARSSGEQVDVWAEVDGDAGATTDGLGVVATGESLPPVTIRFLGTAVMPSGLVWHVYDMRGLRR